MTTIELHGHGDPLLEVAMKAWVKEVPKHEVVTKVSHEVAGHGDPLFQATQKHDRPVKHPLHAEFKGQGDPLMDEFIKEWHMVEKGPKEQKKGHGEMKKQGDPLLMETMIHDAKGLGTKLR